MLGGGGRRGMGGGVGGGGGGMMKSFNRAVRAHVGGAQQNSNASGGAKGSKKLIINRPTSPTRSLSLSPYSSAPLSPFIHDYNDEAEWEYVSGSEDENHVISLYENYVFGTVPSPDEVYHAVSALQQALCCSARGRVGEAGSEYSAGGDDEEEEKMSVSGIDWYEPSHSLYSSRMLQHYPRSDIAYEAFHLLETEPSVQRMVVSLSSDENVWKAVMNNEVVRELQESIRGVESLSLNGEEEDKEEVSRKKKNILEWIVKFAKSKIIQLLEKMTEILKKKKKNPKEEDGGGGGDGGGLDERVKSSFFLSLMVIIIVILTRANPKTIR